MIYHIATKHDWTAAQKKGEYKVDSLQTEGFIHCSMREQVAGVAERHFKGKSGLLLLKIDPKKLTSILKFEGKTEEKFPHIYGPINLDAVIGMTDFEPDSAIQVKQ